MRRRSAAAATMLLVLAVILVVPGLAGFGAAGGSAPGAGVGERAVPDGPVVLVGTTGVRWDGLTAAPFLAGLLEEGGPDGRAAADAAGLALTTGAAARCPVGGWLALSAGGLAESAASPGAECRDPAVVPGHGTGQEAAVAGWTGWQALQRDSAYGARLGRLGEALGGVCSTAVGAGAAVALARADGSVGRYRDDVGPGAFDCPVTVVDAGSALLTRAEAEGPDAAGLREERLTDVDDRIRRVLENVPRDATVVLADLANQRGRPPELGVGMVLRPAAADAPPPRYLTSSATRTTAVARAADLPATLLAAAGAAGAAGAGGIEDTPLVLGGDRPETGPGTIDALADLTDRDLARRAAYAALVGGGFWVVLAVAGLCWWAGARGRATRRARTVAAGAALFLGALPVAGFLASLTGWWRFALPGVALGAAVTVVAGLVAGLAALAPARPTWARPGALAGVTFAVLTVDGLAATVLNRAAPLGAVPTYGARFYGFGNPTFCVYAVAAVVFAAAVAQWLGSRGRNGLAAVVVAGVGLVTVVVDVLPAFGADLGGGPALVPAFAVLGIAAYGGRLRARRVVAVTAAGALLVAAVGVADWLRPSAQRSHLGRFVADVVDGGAWSLLARKAAYAARSVLAGPPVWVTVLVLLAVALVVLIPGPGRRLEPAWAVAAREAWPLLRPAVAAIWVIAVIGSLTNDFGLRIGMICLLVAVPLVTLAALGASRTVQA
ncbi:hypothetical protein [Myceligenerans indicum]|uniref:Uncharacterized protein n=1 Tax=Myceligenerans indicum TaxID=2593663 RepID=A0ABS1LM68_9MICO|nr:hypothetical protein [Myceligenerans indicum]MBL0887300.1 hypothetical protein [Myceligenerans indicum]